MDGFDGQSVLVTGASRGIGAATARFFAERGARVTLLARDGERLSALVAELAAAGGTALAHPGDVACFDDLRAAVGAAVERFGGLDVLVNNAGTIRPIARLAEADPEAWGHAVDVNLKGVYHGMRAALPVMEAAGRGTIVNLSSGAATRPLEGWSSYCAAKAAVLALTRCGHAEYGPRGIRVVGLSPGTVRTDMQVKIRRSGVNEVSRLDPSVHIPPEWVARAVGFLCGPGGEAFAGEDFALKTDEGRRRVGLPPVGERTS